jgi:hypothetical protein
MGARLEIAVFPWNPTSNFWECMSKVVVYHIALMFFQQVRKSSFYWNDDPRFPWPSAIQFDADKQM